MNMVHPLIVDDFPMSKDTGKKGLVFSIVA